MGAAVSVLLALIAWIDFLSIRHALLFAMKFLDLRWSNYDRVTIGEQVKSIKKGEKDGATVNLSLVRRRFCAGWLAQNTAL